MSECRCHLLSEFEKVKMLLNDLPQDSLIREALDNEKLKEIKNRINTLDDKELEVAYHPPVFCFLLKDNKEIVTSLDGDMRLVINHTAVCKAQIVSFLKAGERQDREWLSGIFDLGIKARILSVVYNKCVKLEYPVEINSDKKCDAVINCKHRSYYIESTVLNQSDEDRAVHERWMNDIKKGGNRVLGRPGKFDQPNSKGPSPYYDCWRTYVKVYDKLALDFDPQKTQMSSNGPNLLLLSNQGALGLMGVQWAIDELFIDQPAGKRNGPTDISLKAWLEHTAKERNLLKETFNVKYNDLMSAPRKISGVLVFQDNKLVHSQINYHAKHKLTHREMSIFEEIFTTPFEYL